LFDLPCPKWETEDPGKLPFIADAASAAFEFIRRQCAKRYILNHGDLKEWHRKLFEKIVPVPYYAGHYRGSDPSRPCLDTEVEVGPNQGTPPADVGREMSRFSAELEKAIKATDEYVDRGASPVERLQAAAHLAAFAGGTVIRIHPFINGNGRIARFAMNFFLYRYLKKIPFSINRPPHYDYGLSSEIAMRDGNYIPLYQYLLQIIALS
jgi:fido (protein-threonine AMPylation protein)